MDVQIEALVHQNIYNLPLVYVYERVYTSMKNIAPKVVGKIESVKVHTIQFYRIQLPSDVCYVVCY